MPPELLLRGRLSLAGDVYSYGIMLWEILSGVRPFKGMRVAEVINRVGYMHERPAFQVSEGYMACVVVVLLSLNGLGSHQHTIL